MTTNNKTLIGLEEGWTLIQKGITKLKNLLEEVPEQQFSREEYMMSYTTIFNMCTQMPPHSYSEELYDKYKESCQNYISTMVLPALREKTDEFMLREIVKQWNNYTIMALWLSRSFRYLDRWFIPMMRLPALNEISLTCFQDQVYAEMKYSIKDAMITLIESEREGGHIDQSLLKNVMGIIKVIGMQPGGVDSYESDFEQPILTHTAAYYSTKAASWIEENSCPDYMLKVEECLTRDKERVRYYLHACSQSKLLEIVQHELLTQYKIQLLEHGHSGCYALLRDAKVKDLSRMYKLYCKIPEGLQPFAAIFRQHVTDQGTALVKTAEDAAGKQQAEKKERQASQEQDFVGNLIELHDKFLSYVRNCFGNHSLFHKSLKEAFEVFCNKGVAGSTSAEFLVIFCDNLLKKGGSEGLSEETMECTLDKVVDLLAYIHDKDLFAEFYRKKLAFRLLFDRSANGDYEQGIVKRLKQQCGGHFTSNMEAMLTDFTLARESQTSFEEYLNKNSTYNPGIDLTVTVLNTRCWPGQKPSKLAMPPEMVRCVEVFKEFYATKTKKRKLTWIHSLGTCTVIGYSEPKPVELTMTTYQAALLLLFNRGDKLSYADIKEQLINLPDEDIVRLLHSVSCAKYKILTKDPSTNTVKPADSFSFNSKFTHRMSPIRVSSPPQDQKKKVIEALHQDRRYSVDACIVRILKSRKVLSYQQLVVECVGQLREMFKPDIKIFKQRIEDLIHREYFERNKDNPSTLRYLN